MNTGANRSVHSKKAVDFQGIPTRSRVFYGGSWPGASKTQLFLKILAKNCACAMFEEVFFKTIVFYAILEEKIGGG